MLHIGPSGIPASAAQPTIRSGLDRLAELGLTALEIAWVHGARTSDPECALIKEHSQRIGIALTAHGSYYINLNAVDAEKRAASRQRLVEAVRKAALAGVQKVVVHAAFYLESSPADTQATVIHELGLINNALTDTEKEAVHISLETTGKPTQWGTVEEILAVCQHFDNLQPCLDFSHLYARSLGQNHGYDYTARVLEQMGKASPDALSSMHIHLSGIEYGAKGEKQHRLFSESQFDYMGAIRALKAAEVSGFLIIESPAQEVEAQLIAQIYTAL